MSLPIRQPQSRNSAHEYEKKIRYFPSFRSLDSGGVSQRRGAELRSTTYASTGPMAKERKSVVRGADVEGGERVIMDAGEHVEKPASLRYN